MPLACIRRSSSVSYWPAAAVGLGVLLLRPSAARAEEDPWWGRDKALHLGVSAAAALIGYGGGALLFEEPWQRALCGAGFSLSLGAGKELYDLQGGGNASWKDFTWDVVGTTLGVSLSIGIDSLLSRPDRVEKSSPNRAALLYRH